MIVETGIVLAGVAAGHFIVGEVKSQLDAKYNVINKLGASLAAEKQQEEFVLQSREITVYKSYEYAQDMIIAYFSGDMGAISEEKFNHVRQCLKKLRKECYPPYARLMI